MATKFGTHKEGRQTCPEPDSEVARLQQLLMQQEQALEAQVQENFKLKKELENLQGTNDLTRSIGQVKHQINQPLTLLLGNAQLLIKKEYADTERKEMLAEIYDAGKEISDLIGQVQTLQAVE